MDPRNKLKPIREMPDEQLPVRDVSSSEKPPKLNHMLINDTILEEQESFGMAAPEDMDLPQSSQEASE
jgi:hypothetical protein